MQANAQGPDDTHGGRDWNQVIRNVKIVLGNNPGAVGIRHAGAQGSSAQEVSIDGSVLTVTDNSTPPADLVSRHLYRVALCNIEAADNIFVDTYGANPNDTLDDTLPSRPPSMRVTGSFCLPVRPMHRVD